MKNKTRKIRKYKHVGGAYFKEAATRAGETLGKVGKNVGSAVSAAANSELAKAGVKGATAIASTGFEGANRIANVAVEGAEEIGKKGFDVAGTAIGIAKNRLIDADNLTQSAVNAVDRGINVGANLGEKTASVAEAILDEGKKVKDVLGTGIKGSNEIAKTGFSFANNTLTAINYAMFEGPVKFKEYLANRKNISLTSDQYIKLKTLIQNKKKYYDKFIDKIIKEIENDKLLKLNKESLINVLFKNKKKYCKEQKGLLSNYYNCGDLVEKIKEIYDITNPLLQYKEQHDNYNKRKIEIIKNLNTINSVIHYNTETFLQKLDEIINKIILNFSNNNSIKDAESIQAFIDNLLTEIPIQKITFENKLLKIEDSKTKQYNDYIDFYNKIQPIINEITDINYILEDFQNLVRKEIIKTDTDTSADSSAASNTIAEAAIDTAEAAAAEIVSPPPADSAAVDTTNLPPRPPPADSANTGEPVAATSDSQNMPPLPPPKGGDRRTRKNASKKLRRRGGGRRRNSKKKN